MLNKNVQTFIACDAEYEDSNALIECIGFCLFLLEFHRC